MARRERVAVCCTRKRDDGVELLMIHDRAGRWTLPKGAVERRETLAEAAAREALEEAGVAVVLDEDRRTTWKHRRLSGEKQRVVLLGAKAHHVADPEEHWRRPTWVPVATLERLAETDDHYRRLAKAVRRLGVKAKGGRRPSAAA